MRLRIILCLLTTLLALAVPQPAYANIAPPPYLPGGNIQPSQTTKVQMVAEHVLMAVKEIEPDKYVVEVTADFVMLNRGDADEQLRVRFPLEYVQKEVNYYENEISDFKVWIDHKPVAITIVQEPYQLGDDSIPWATFDVLFRSGQYVLIRVNYINSLKGDFYTRISYTIGTGSGWYGTIEDATVTVRLPYAANMLNIIGFDGESYDYGFQKIPENVVIMDDEIIWHWYNHEPDPYEKVDISILHPLTWKDFLGTEANFEDIDSIIQLSRNYLFWLYFNSKFGDLAEITLKRALTLYPDSIPLHTELANVYYIRCCVGLYVPDGAPDLAPSAPVDVIAERLQRPLDASYAPKLKDEVDIILALDPTNQQALAYKSAIEQAAMIIASQTPSPSPTATPRPSPRPTATPRPSPRPTATPRPSPSPTATATTSTHSPVPVMTSTVAATFTPSPAAMRRDQAATNPVGSYLLIGVVGIIIGFAAGAVVTKKWW